MRLVFLAMVAFVSAFGAYLLLAGQASGTEIAAGVPVATLVAAFAVLVHGGDRRRLRLRAPWGRLAWLVCASLLRDGVRVGGVLLRALVAPGAVAGTIDAQPFRPGGIDPSDAGRRALVTLASSLAPNGFVLDLAPSLLLREEPRLLVHHLARAAPSPNPDWPA